MNEFRFACSVCHTPLSPLDALRQRCPVDGLVYERRDGIWHFLTPDRQVRYAQFMREYQIVRQAEQRGSTDAAFYRSLPFGDLSGHFAADWQIRARSFRAFEREVLLPLEKELKTSSQYSRASRPGSHARQLAAWEPPPLIEKLQLEQPLRVIDLGAGNGWLSYRLAQRGHAVAAVDLLTNPLDGLGAHIHYDAAFTPLQADFDQLPFTEEQIDLVIFNASLHYSTHYETTLTEALRVLRPNGRVIILDSPIYRSADSGAQMVREREAAFTQAYGFPSNALLSENYLTEQRLKDLAEMLGLQWTFIRPFYGWRWRLRPLKARLLRRREPARFAVIVGRRWT
jgi:SAM-dependent methyltransferase